MPELRGGALIALILAASGLDFLLFGYDQGLFGGILAGDGFVKMLGEPSPTLTGGSMADNHHGFSLVTICY
jgi:hypothetical protein